MKGKIEQNLHSECKITWRKVPFSDEIYDGGETFRYQAEQIDFTSSGQTNCFVKMLWWVNVVKEDIAMTPTTAFLNDIYPWYMDIVKVSQTEAICRLNGKIPQSQYHTPVDINAEGPIEFSTGETWDDLTSGKEANMKFTKEGIQIFNKMIVHSVLQNVDTLTIPHVEVNDVNINIEDCDVNIVCGIDEMFSDTKVDLLNNVQLNLSLL